MCQRRWLSQSCDPSQTLLQSGGGRRRLGAQVESCHRGSVLPCRPVPAQPHDDKCGTNLTLLADLVLVHSRSRRGHSIICVAQGSSLRAAANSSRMTISRGIRGDKSALLSASFRCAKVIPKSSSASIRSNSIVTTGPMVTGSGPTWTAGSLRVGTGGLLKDAEDVLMSCGGRTPEWPPQIVVPDILGGYRRGRAARHRHVCARQIRTGYDRTFCHVRRVSSTSIGPVRIWIVP